MTWHVSHAHAGALSRSHFDQWDDAAEWLRTMLRSHGVAVVLAHGEPVTFADAGHRCAIALGDADLFEVAA